MSYALRQKLALLPVTAPDAAPTGHFGAVDNAFRYRLRRSDYRARRGGVAGRLMDRALCDLLNEAERRHAHAIRLRREELLLGVRDSLARHDFDVIPVDQWALVAEKKKSKRIVVLVTPRAPIVADLRVVDQFRNLPDHPELRDAQAVVVHNASDVDESDSKLIEWACRDRRISAVTAHALEGACLGSSS